MSRHKNTRFFLLIVLVFFLVSAFCPKVEAAAGNLLNICTQNGSQYYPASAWNSDKSEYLTVWFNDLDPDRGIYGVRLYSDGNFKPNSSPFKIASYHGNGIYSPSVACNPQKNQYLVTWQDQDQSDTSSTNIYAALVSFNDAGIMKTTPITGIHKFKEKSSSPKVAWNGEQYLIVWYDYSGVAPTGLVSADIYGVRIDSDGIILDPDGLEICTAASAQTDPVITGYHKSGGSEEKGWLVAWVDSRDSSSGKDIYAALLKQNADAIVSKGESFPICKAEKDQQFPSVAPSSQGFFVVWLDGRYKDISDGTGGSYGNFLFSARLSFDGQLLLNSYGTSTDMPIAVLTPYEGRTPSPVPSVACVQNNYLVVWDYKSQVLGTRISLEGDILDVQNGVPTPFTLSDTHKDSTMPSLAPSDTGSKALITWLVADASQNKDISGVIYTLPKSPQLSWANGATAGVSPTEEKGGTEFTFKVNYTKADGGNEPLDRRLLVDLNHNGIYEQNEMFGLEKVGSSTVYQKKTSILYDGIDPDDLNSCLINYRFYFRDEYNAAEGEPTNDHTVKITARDNVPQLSWLGEGGYVQDGVDPDNGTDGTEFTFQVKYKDADGNAPQNHQVWIDINGNNAFEDSEKFSLEEVDSGSNYAGGVGYQYKKSIKVGWVGLVSYRFYFDDKYNVAQGEPKETQYLAITNISENCIHRGPGLQISPDIASTSGGSLVVWEDLRDAEVVDQNLPGLYNGSKVYGLLLDNQGKKLDRPEIRIGDPDQSKFKPRVAASRSNNFYLAVWEDLRNGKVETSGSSPGYMNTDIYGQIVDADNPSNQIPEVAIATYTSDFSTSNQNNPAVAAGPDNKFLVVWEDSMALDVVGKNIHGAIVTYSPGDSKPQVNVDAASNDNFIIYDEDYGKDQTNPAVAFGGQNYLVVWQDYRPELADDDTNSHLYANPVDLDGHVMAGAATIDHSKRNGWPICIDPNTTQEHPAIASDGTKFLVVWEHKSTGLTLTGKDIYGILVMSNGSIPSGQQPFAICRAKGDQINPRVSWDKISNTYLVVWTSQSFTRNVKGESSLGYDTDIRGARIDTAGKLIGSSTADSAGWEICTLQGIQDAPAISGNESLNQVVWMDNRAYPYALSYGLDIYGIPFKSFLNWVEDAGYFYGVNPGIAGNGKNYTFKINYLDMSGRNPKVSQVWIDLDGDGTYNGAGEKLDLSSDNSDLNTADGKVYFLTKSLTIPDNYKGDGRIVYRFYFEDADSSPVAGNANLPEILQINPPWVTFTGETNYQASAVYPATGTAGTTFEFRVLYLYRPSEQVAADYDDLLKPDTAQIWIDLDQNENYEGEGEKIDLTQADQNDQTYADGMKYSYKFTGHQNGTYRYRFYFKHSDGGAAIGSPTQDHFLTISEGGSTPSVTYPTWTTYKKPKVADDQITSLAKQDDNILWVGTAAGLSKFDGSVSDPNRAWSTITPATESNLAGSAITALAYDSKLNILYVGTSQGLSSYNSSSGWKKFDQTSTGGVLGKNYILFLAVNKKNQELWIASAPGSQASYGLMPNSSARYGLAKNQSRFATENDPNNSALIQYNPSENTWTAYNTENTSSDVGGGLPSNYIMALAVDSNGGVWVSTVVYTGTGENLKAEYKGLSRFNPDPVTKGWTQYTTTSNNDNGKLKTNHIRNIVGDEHNNLWVGGAPEIGDVDGTGGGLYRFDLQDNTWADYFYKGRAGVNMGSNAVTALAVDGTNIWVGTYPNVNTTSGNVTGGGVSLYNGSTWKLFTTSSGLAGNFVVAIAVQTKDEKDKNGDNKKDVWLATPTGLSRYGCGPGDSKKPHSYFDPKDSFAFSDSKGCFVNSLGNPFNQNSSSSHRNPWSGWILLVMSLLGTGIAFPFMVRRYLWVRR